MTRLTDLTGQRFGRWEVIAHDRADACHRHRWFCRCECGTVVSVMAQSLVWERSRSCGCHGRVAAWAGFGDISASYWGRLRSSAARRAIPFDVTIEQGWAEFEKQGRRCALSGLPIAFVEKRRVVSNPSDQTASLDRIASRDPYVLGNVQWVHKHINLMKMYLPQDRFIELCGSVACHAGSAA